MSATAAGMRHENGAQRVQAREQDLQRRDLLVAVCKALGTQIEPLILCRQQGSIDVRLRHIIIHGHDHTVPEVRSEPR